MSNSAGTKIVRSVVLMAVGALATLGVEHRSLIAERTKEAAKKANKMVRKLPSWATGKRK